MFSFDSVTCINFIDRKCSNGFHGVQLYVGWQRELSVQLWQQKYHSQGIPHQNQKLQPRFSIQVFFFDWELSILEAYPGLIRLATFFPHFFFSFCTQGHLMILWSISWSMHIMILQCMDIEYGMNQPTGTTTISALVWRAYDKSAVVLFFEGEVLDKKLLGRCIIESAASQLEIFPAITMTDDSTFEVDWDESEAVDFIIVRNILWMCLIISSKLLCCINFLVFTGRFFFNWFSWEAPRLWKWNIWHVLCSPVFCDTCKINNTSLKYFYTLHYRNTPPPCAI